MAETEASGFERLKKKKRVCFLGRCKTILFLLETSAFTYVCEYK